jgi:hypothetical protein
MRVAEVGGESRYLFFAALVCFYPSFKTAKKHVVSLFD